MPKKMILVVDDDPTSIKLATIVLEKSYDVRIVKDSERAFDAALKVCPDLILLDVMMPGIDGYEVCRQLQECTETQDIPVIFLSGKTESIDEAKGFEFGAVDYIHKPFSGAVMLARINTHLTLKHQRDLLRKLTITDGLTGVTSRRGFDELLQREWRRCSRAKLPISVLAVDIDYLKQYNDHYGHQEGDYCIKTIAESLKLVAFRAFDIIARYDGGQFVLILPETGNMEMLQIADRIHEETEILGIPHVKTPELRVTVSIGGYTQVPGSMVTPSAIMSYVDQRLYNAKQAGRNTSCFK